MMNQPNESEEILRCSCCGAEVEQDDAVEMEEEFLCSDCAESQTVLCKDCGTRIWESDCVSDATHTLCNYCYEDHFGRCEVCERIVNVNAAYYLEDDEDEEFPHCLHCYQRLDVRYIHEYGYKPEPLFYGEGPRYFGVELEIDDAGKKSGNAEKILSAGNRCAEHIYIKTDSSLTDGLEIVTHPMTLDYHLDKMPWQEVVETALRLGYHSHKADTCGLHIHISRESFGRFREEQEEHISHLLYLVEKFWGELLRFSRRTEYSLKRWAARYGMKEKPIEILDAAKKGYGGRYVCVNLQNRDTIEIRIFRGTLKLNTIYATLQLVNRLCDVAVSLSEAALEGFSWTEFVEHIRGPELIQYLKERRLYLNEPVTAEEDE